ncbi:MAG: adenylosuccinate lyase [Parcubacteria group bacterium Gr01-1014_31]|nr:MAG: adenylosuccinate lyase [Parcubacteria group bacterium Gr01-1014_31]
MLKRYTLPPMRELWLREEAKYEHWHQVELAVLAARESVGDAARGTHAQICENARINVARIEELDAIYEHDLLAFIGTVQESLRQAGVPEATIAEYHKRLTSYDVEDPALILQLGKAAGLIHAALSDLEQALRERAQEHQWTLMIATTHGQDAEPTTFGHLLLVFAEAVRRSAKRLEQVIGQEIAAGKISGAVGNYADLSPEIETQALELLGLRPANAETQILQRDRHATLLNTLAVAGATIEQMARTFWEMCRSRCRELQEPRKPKQRGSSAMPWKINPIKLEQFQGLARLLRGLAHTAVENIATPDFRDISQSSVERHILPDATGLTHYLAVKMAAVVRGLVVFPDRMARNLAATCGVWAGNRVRTALLEHGIPYDAAYEYVQRVSFEAVQSETSVLDLFAQRPFSDADPRTARDLLGSRLDTFFDAAAYVARGVHHLFRHTIPISRKETT